MRERQQPMPVQVHRATAAVPTIVITVQGRDGCQSVLLTPRQARRLLVVLGGHCKKLRRHG